MIVNGAHCTSTDSEHARQSGSRAAAGAAAQEREPTGSRPGL